VGCQGFATPRPTAARPGQPTRAPDNTYSQEGKGSAGNLCHTRSDPLKRNDWLSDPPAGSRFQGTALRKLIFGWAIPSVSRPAGCSKLNLRGRPWAVPANGCLVTLMRWPNSKGSIRENRSASARPALMLQETPSRSLGEVCFPLTNPYHGCPLTDTYHEGRFLCVSGQSGGEVETTARR